MNGRGAHATWSRFPIRIRTGWSDYSPALRWHASRRIEMALRDDAMTIREATVRIVDDGADGKRCEIDVALKPFGWVSASASGTTSHDCVERAIDRLTAVLRRRGRSQPLDT